MGIFDFFRKSGPSREQIIKEMTDPSRQFQKAVFRYMGTNNPIWKDDNTQNYVDYGYNYNWLVRSIVYWKAQKAANVPLVVYKMVNGKKEYVDSHWCLELFDRPNQWQGKLEFFEQLYGFNELDGNGYVFAPKIEAGANKGRVSEMHVLPSPLTEIVTGEKYNPIGGYRIEFSASVSDFSAEDVLHIRYPNYDFNYESYVYGVSPLRAAWRNVQKSNSNISAAKSAFDNMGALGLLYKKVKEFEDSLTDEQVKKAQYQLDKKVRGTDKNGRLLWAEGDYGYLNFGASPVDLALIEDEKLTARQLCTAFNVQSEMFSDNERATENNKQFAIRQSYIDGVKPNVNRFVSEWNRHIMAPLGDFRIEADFSAVEELQADLSKQAEWLAKAMWLTENEKREAMGYERKPGLDVNMYPASYLPTDSLPNE